MRSLDGKHALVTGGGRGIGRAIAAALTQAGAAVTIAGRSEKPLAEVVGKGEAAGYVIADVTDAKAVDSGVRQAVAARGPVDILVANAGTATGAPFAKAKPEQFRDMFEQHVIGMVHPAQAVLGGMIERGFGRIVAVASIVGLRASPNVSPYTTAKHAMLGLVRSIALETAGTGVTVNAVCPGYVDTELIRAPIDRMVEQGMSQRGRARPLHRAGSGRPAGQARGGRRGRALFLFAARPQRPPARPSSIGADAL